MLKARAVERFLGQIVDPDGDGISGVMLFNKEGINFCILKLILHEYVNTIFLIYFKSISGMTLAKTGKSLENGNVYSALLSNIWETFEQQGKII